MKRSIVFGLLAALLLTMVAPSRGLATTVVSVGPFVPQTITPGQTTQTDISFHTDPAVDSIVVRLIPLTGGLAEILSYNASCGAVASSSDILTFNDQGCIRGQIDIVQHLHVSIFCFRPGTYMIEVLAAHEPALPFATFVCTNNPLHTGPVPPISGNVRSWLSFLVDLFERPTPSPNG